MNENSFHHPSQEISDRFDRGERVAHTPEEEAVFQAYHQIRHTLRTYPVDSLNPQDLAETLQREFQQNDTPIKRWSEKMIRFKSLSIAAAFVFILLGAGLFTFYSPNHPPVQSIEFSHSPQSNPVYTSWFWEKRLQRGYTVTFPTQTELHLSDGSAIDCSPGTRLAIAIEKNRLITLKAGEIVVHAAHVSGSTMIVETPFLSVQVVGTVFRLKVID